MSWGMSLSRTCLWRLGNRIMHYDVYNRRGPPCHSFVVFVGARYFNRCQPTLSQLNIWCANHRKDIMFEIISATLWAVDWRLFHIIQLSFGLTKIGLTERGRKRWSWKDNASETRKERSHQWFPSTFLGSFITKKQKGFIAFNYIIHHQSATGIISKQSDALPADSSPDWVYVCGCLGEQVHMYAEDSAVENLFLKFGEH